MIVDLIEKLKLQVGITDEQAQKAVEVIKDFVKEKFPMFSGAIDDAFKKYAPGNKDDFMP
ncbi:MAG: hypothetical protein JNK79_20620 [Chitinophagaceae bacterium]|nr:hypothetical protein [Chitinophagaceae bacterium]